MLCIMKPLIENVKFHGTRNKLEELESNCPWWTTEYDELIKNRKEILRKFKQTGLFEDFIEYKKSS